MTGSDVTGAHDGAMDRSTLMAAITAGRVRLVERLARLSDDAMLDPVDGAWTGKDVVAHLEAWERRVVANLEVLRRGATPDRSIGTDELNDRFFKASRDRPLDDVRAGEDEAYRSVLATIDEASDEELFDGRHFAWTAGEPLANWFRGNTDEHYDEHLEQLTRPPRADGLAELALGPRRAPSPLETPPSDS